MRFSVFLLLAGCLRGTAGSFTTQKVVPSAAAVADVDLVCRTGGALRHALGAISKKPAHEALIIAETTAGLCDEAAADEAALEALIARRQAKDPVAAVKDARERERRLRARAAGRFHRAWGHTLEHFGELGEACPKIRSKDELTLLVGLMAGTLAMLHDKASGGTHQVPLDTLNRVGRTGACVDGWWGAPQAFEAAAWAVVPGSGPAEVDPWERLREVAAAGDDEGVRLGWALLAMVAENAGREPDVAFAIEQAAASFEATRAHPDWLLFDTYARQRLQLEADRRWIQEHGHRAPDLSLPTPEEAMPAPGGADPFAEDPFGADPFGGDSADPFAETPTSEPAPEPAPAAPTEETP